MPYDLVHDDYTIERRNRPLARYVEPVRPLLPRFRLFSWGRLTDAELIIREARLTRLREEEEFRSAVARQHHRIYLAYNEEVTDHEAAVMADVKKRSILAKGEILKALDRQEAKERAEELIDDPLEVREVNRSIDAIYEYEPVPMTPPSVSVNGTKNQAKAQKQTPEKESIV